MGTVFRKHAVLRPRQREQLADPVPLRIELERPVDRGVVDPLGEQVGHVTHRRMHEAQHRRADSLQQAQGEQHGEVARQGASGGASSNRSISRAPCGP